MAESPSDMTSQPAGSLEPAAPKGVEEQAEQRSRRQVLKPARMSLNLTSMIDVIFQLLIYFVVTANFAIDEGVLTANLPGKSSGQAPRDPIKIIIQDIPPADFRITLEPALSNTDPADFQQLRSILETVIAEGLYEKDHTVVIEPEGRVRWQHVVNAFNATTHAELAKVSFASPRSPE